MRVVGLAVVVTLLLAAGLVEGFLALLLAFPSRNPLVLPLARYYYFTLDRDIIQFNPAAARWDAELFYTLRPGRFTFVQREFRHEFRINRLGLRDEETALAGPEIVVLGDSHTMGWGVGQDETYAKLVEKATGKRTLNAGIASYGTVRAMLLLNRIDISRLRYLVVQYSADDVFENLAFWRQGNRHLSRSEAQWDRTTERLARRRHYYPGKYVWEGLYRLYRQLTRPARAEAGAEPDAPDLFLNALTHAPGIDLRNRHLLVWAIPGSDILPTLRERLREPRSRTLPEIMLVDIAPRLDPHRHFWVLDDHLNAGGHRVVAERLVEAIAGLEARKASTRGQGSSGPSGPGQLTTTTSASRRRGSGVSASPAQGPAVQ